jgi:carboxylesterase
MMGEALNQEGYTVLGVRLPGHATRQADLPRTRWQDWLAAVEDGWHLLRGAADPIVLVGLSMGGALSLLFASGRYAAECSVAGVVAMSTPYDLKPDPRFPFIRLLHPLVPQVMKGPSDFRDAQMGKEHVSYPAYPTRSIAELRDVLAEMRAALPEVTAPALLIHARGDTGGGFFDPLSMEKIHAALGSREKEMRWVENSGHIITRDQARAVVFQAALDFIHRITRPH